MAFTQGKGWRKDKFDSRDYPRQPYRYGAAQIPDVVDLSVLLALRLDQDGQNGCVGAAIRTGLCATLKSLKAYAEDESWLWPWLGARFKEGTCSQNVGCYPRDAFDWLVEQGCLYDRYLHFSGQFDATPPSSAQMAAAIKYANFAYFRVGDGAQGIMESLAESQAALQAGEPAWLICLGGPWPDKWMSAPGGILADISTNDPLPTEGHEYIIYGYDKPNGKLFMANSWGNGWGKDGTALLPVGALAVFKAWGGYDGMYATFKADPIPVPPPPTPTTYIITATAGLNGSILPSGVVNVKQGDTEAFVITPNTSYQTSDVAVDGVLRGPIDTFTFNNIQTDHTINASFALVPVPPPPPLPPLVITTVSLPAGTVGVAYNQTMAATGGMAPYVWSILTGTLPLGLTLDPNSGGVSGIPASTGMYNFTIGVEDSNATSGHKILSILINPQPSPPPGPTPSKCKWGNGVASVLNIYSKLAKRQGRFYYLNQK